MSKPTMFFSHSSKDRDAILMIKNKLDSATGGVLDIFMSSDGQSIPFGTNWIHKIEEGLEAAKIMFVFVTEESVASGWIHFEAGFAYSKGIKVVPVGIGIDIGALKAPLNMLQGFNITSEDSLNNFITIINESFDYHFKEAFDKDDYAEIIRLTTVYSTPVCFEKMIDHMECAIESKMIIGNTLEEYDLDDFFHRIIEHLDSNSIMYSRVDNYEDNKLLTCVMVYGIKIVYRMTSPDSARLKAERPTYIEDITYIKFNISPYNFEKSFNLLKSLLSIIRARHSLRVDLKRPYAYRSVEDSSSIISCSDGFGFKISRIGGYVCNELDLEFYIDDDDVMTETKDSQNRSIMWIIYNCDSVSANKIAKLMYGLYDIGLIQKV